MQYALLIYADEANEPHYTTETTPTLLAPWAAFNDELVATGSLMGGSPLDSVATATTVRVRDGETVITDGPFAETKEMLGGFYIIEAENLDEAIKWAAKIPSAGRGSVEVRPVMTYDYGTD